MKNITNITDNNESNEHMPKNYKDKIYAKGTKYIHVENIIKYAMYCTHFRTEMMSSQ